MINKSSSEKLELFNILTYKELKTIQTTASQSMHRDENFLNHDIRRETHYGLSVDIQTIETALEVLKKIEKNAVEEYRIINKLI